MTTFYLVRHALTEHTGARLSGRMEGIHLSDDGRKQADLVAESLAHVPFRAIYSSPIERAMETARPVAAKHGLPVQVAPDMTEVEFGKWTNRSFKTLRRTKLWEKVQRFPSSVRFPDGETLYEVQARAVAQIERLASMHAKQAVCVVSHADVIKLVAAQYVGTHLDLFQRLLIAPASVSVIGLGDHEPRILALNNGLPAPQKET
jgi:probable phosphomutase (TIGR03848 family)